MTKTGRRVNNKRIPAWLVIICIVAGAPLLFVGGPEYYDSRISKLLWDLGHIPFMFFFGVAVVLGMSRVFAMRYLHRFSLYLFIILTFSVATELVQGEVGRVPSYFDVLADTWGALLAWLLMEWGVVKKGTFQGRLLTLATLILGVIVLTKPALILYDELLARTQFPLIAGFESASELSRWDAKNEIVRSKNKATHGQYSLKVLLLPKGYSGVSAKNFPSNWQGFGFFQFDVWSSKKWLPVTLRIHDKAHAVGTQAYTDRFNRRFKLDKGWNRILVELGDVQRAPKARELDLKKVIGISLFSYNLGTTETLYLDNVLLSGKSD